MWIRRTRLTLLIALLLATAILAYLAANPRIYAGHVSKLVTRHFLRDTGLAFTYRDVEGNPFGNLSFSNVSVTRSGDRGSFAYLNCDTLQVHYDLRALLRGQVHLSHVDIAALSVVVREAPKVAGAAKKKGPSVGPIELPLRMDEVLIRDASLMATDATQAPTQQISGVTWIGSARTDDGAVVLDTKALRGTWHTRSLRVHRARGQITLSPEGIGLAQVHVETDSSRVDLDGLVGGERIDLATRGAPALLADVFNFLKIEDPPQAVLEGEVKVDVEKTPERDIVLLQGTQLDGTIEGYDFQQADVQLRLTSTSKIMEIHSVDAILLGAAVSGSGSLDLDGAVLDVRGQGAQLDLSRRWTGEDLDWPVTSLQGNLHLRTKLESPAALTLKVEGARGTITDLAVRDLNVDLRFDEATGVVVDAASAQTLGMDLNGEGTISPEGQVALNVRATGADLVAWSQRTQLPVEGEDLNFEGVLEGTAEELALRGQASLRRLAGYDLDVSGIAGTVRMAQWDDPSVVSADLTARELHLRGERLGDAKLRFAREAPTTEVARLTIASGDTTLSLSGLVEEGDDEASLRFDSMDFSLGSQVWSLARPAGLEVGPGWFSAQDVEISSATGSLHVEGGLDRNGGLDFEARLQAVELALLPRLGFGPPDLVGEASGSVRLDGTSDVPGGRIEIAVGPCTGFDRSFDRLDAHLTSSGATVQVDSLVAESQHGAMRLAGGMVMPRADWLRAIADDITIFGQLVSGARLDLDLFSDDMDPRYWATGFTEVPDDEIDFGRVRGQVRIRGTGQVPVIEGPVTVVGLTTPNELVLPQLDAEIRADERGLTMVGGTILAPDPWLRVQGRIPLRLSAVELPRWEPAAGIALDLYSDGEVELAPLGNVWPHLRKIEGKMELRYEARGNTDAPQLNGGLELRDVTVQFDRSLETFYDGTLSAQIQGDRLEIESIDAREGMKGKVTGTGYVGFEGLIPDAMGLTLDCDRFQLLSVPELRAILSGRGIKVDWVRLNEDGSRVPSLTGTVEVIKAEYRGKFADEESAEGAAFGPTARPSWLANMRIRAPRTVRILNDVGQLTLEGDVDLIRDEAGLRLRGQSRIAQGRVPIFNNDFTITNGSLDFSRFGGLEPAVDITAETEVPEYDPGSGGRTLEHVIVRFTGTFRNPTLAFESDSSYNDQQIIRLLAGLPPEAASGTIALGDVGLKAGMNYLERSLAGSIEGIDTIDLETEEASLDQASGTRVAIGKYLSNNLYLRFSQGLSITEQALFLEYQITRHLLFTSEIRRRLRENETQAQFNLDIKYRVEY